MATMLATLSFQKPSADGEGKHVDLTVPEFTNGGTWYV